MSKNSFAKALAILLIVGLVAPSAFFIAPQRTSAAGGALGCIFSLLGGASLLTTALAVPVSDMVTRGATTGSCLNDTIFLPLARAMARLLLAKITGSIIGWITGNNGAGQVMFVQNLPGHLQRVGDTQALAFFAQFGRMSNSPFASAISSSLRINYLQNTSAAGFFAANQNTLARYSPNVNSFLAGNWSQGGAAAWFALTTQNQNNPYTLYYASKNQLASLVGSAQDDRLATLNWGRGFLSWCGEAQAGDPATGRVGTAPGDTCRNEDGTYGTVKTPGSIIHGYTQRAVDATGIDWLLTAQDLDAALGAIATALVGQVLGGIGGLFGASTSSGGRVAITTQLQSYSANNTSAASSASSLAQSMLSQIAVYVGAWTTISNAARTASTSVQSLANFCTNAASLNEGTSFASAATAQAAIAETTLTTKIAPVLAQAEAAIDSVAATQTFALQVQAGSEAANSISSTTTAAALSADLSTLLTMPPSATDVVTAQQDAQVLGRAAASPEGSLNVSGGTIVDRMSLIATNAAALKTEVCTKSGSSSSRESSD